MFELLDPASLTDAALIGALEHRTRAEAVAAAQRLALIGEVVARHCDDEDDVSAYSAIDGWEIAAAAVSAACNVSRHQASGQMRIAQALRQRLPKVAAVFARGEVSAKVIAAITWHTQNILDPEALELVDTALAGTAHSYGALSVDKAEQAIDVWVEKFEPAALRRGRTAARSREVNFGDVDDPHGTVSIWGRLLATDAALLKKALTEMARTVCEADPRTMAQRRADALGALAVGAGRLTCQCGSPQCPATGADPRSTNVMIHLLTDQLPHHAPASQDNDGQAGPAHDTTGPAHDTGPAEKVMAEAPRDARLHGDSTNFIADDIPAVAGSPAVIVGGGIVPAPVLAELIATGATVKPLTDAADLGAQNHYRPSAKLAAFVRLRDMRCMFPGCGVAAPHCDLDHCVAWPQGPTHPGNLGAKCRTHHLLKTFPAADGGWTDLQHPDGSHTWTAPTGQTYRTTPFSQILFPHWHTQTPPPTPPPPTTPPPTPPTPTPPQTGPVPTPPAQRDLKMPTRTRTRQQTRTQRINAERRLNTEDGGDDPPF
ncbi:hypothetical protein A5740_03480 [Mycobacterium sp. GA-1841]|uniref:HNH endonuclease signature motif containing protein n=1 Tax=Mycobacterium sp. GA-1841 TaxID=1834154 RepID=UPI00096C62F5|nr:HNH endonuclease signature motif containing protein [Mycobacterium sp. GA-1841]OMC38148.1 hypothetical protein A5740_03480 [Mycobacterium sp. GA-1841]